MQNTKIEWTDRTIQLVRGCREVSPGCANCYAARMAHQLANGHGYKQVPAYKGFTQESDGHVMWSGKVELIESNLTQPLRWKKPAKCFVCSMSDLFHDDVPDIYIRALWLVMANRTDCEFQILTKRIERMATMLSRKEFWEVDAELAEYAQRFKIPVNGIDMRNARAWLGTSASTAEAWRKRKGNLRFVKERTGLPVFVSFEPLVRYACMTPDEDWSWLDVVIVGGESGYATARPMHPRWAREIRNVCQQQGVVFYFKQWGNWKYIEDFFAGRELRPGEHLVDSAHPTKGHVAVMKKMRNKYEITNTLDGKLHQDWPRWPEVQYA